MRKKTNIFWLMLGCAALNTLPAKAYNYKKMWKEVVAFQQKDLPQSALKSVRTIFNKAMNDNNKGEMLKAYLFMLQMKSSLSIDSLQPDMKRLELMTATSKDSVEKAVMHSLLGALYSDQVYNGKYAVVSTSDIPDDMSEWTRPMYRQKARMHFAASLSDKALLSHTSMDAYLPVIVKGNTDNYLGNDLLHVIGRTAVNKLDASEDSNIIRSFYDSMINYYAGEGNRNAAVLVTLNKLDYDYNSGHFRSDDDYARTVRQLIADNPQVETCAEAYITLANMQGQWRGNRTAQLAFVRKGLAAYPKYRRIEALKEIEANLSASYIQITSSKDTSSLLPGKPFDLSFQWVNLNRATLEFYRIKDGYTKDLEKDFDIFTDSFSNKKENDFLKRYTDGRPVFSKTCELKGKPYELNDSTINIPGLTAGIYVVKLVAEGAQEGAQNYELIPVSRLRGIKQNILENGKNYTEFRIVDAISGKPMTETDVVLYDNEGNETGRVRANDRGITRIDRKDRFTYRIISSSDNYSFPTIGNVISYRPQKETVRHSVSLYTDRYVYRPGQTVKIAGITYSRTMDKAEVETNRKLVVRLLDANSRQVGEKEVLTNAYGSFATEFVLPSSTLNGIFFLSTPYGRTSVRVEEYKRPTFKVTFENLTTGYKAGDSLSVVGMAKTYAGVPLQNATVDYTITVHSGYWRKSVSNDPKSISGTTMTDKEGRFIVPLRLIRLPKKSLGYWWYNYNINARVLSAAGETQEGTLTLPLSNRSLYVKIQGISGNPGISETNKILKESDKAITIQVNNLKGEPVDCKGTYVLIPLKDGKPQGKGILKSFTANKTSITKELQVLSSGGYRLIARVEDKTGEVADTMNFVLYSNADVRPPVKTNFWHEVISDEIADTYSSAPTFSYLQVRGRKSQPSWIRNDVGNKKSAVIKVGTSLKDVYLFYRLYNGEQCIDDRQILLNDSILTFNYSYKPEYKKGLKAVFTFMKDGKLYTATDPITVVEPDKQLSMAWGTFRDKLMPGQKENWTMWIERNDRQPFDGAEVIASMYDASLDGIIMCPKWRTIPRNLYPSMYNGGYPSVYNGTSMLNLSAYWPIVHQFKYKPLTYSMLNPYFSDNALNSYVMSSRTLARTSVGMAKFKENTLAETVVVSGLAAPMVAYDKSEAVFNTFGRQPSTMKNPFSRLTTRSDFNETAFFYPQLQTDTKGKLSIAFTLPDALTKWNFRAIAHTKDMLTGVKDTTVTVSKDFMVQPNLPRYVRSGDTVSFPVNLTNLSGKNLDGIARIELMDPDTQQIIYTESQRFTLSKAKNYGLNFRWKVDDRYPAVICKIQAVSGNISDGEQNYIAILNNRELITESIPLSVNGSETITYDLKNLFQKNDPDAQDRRLTVEFTSNPVWHAVQSLPTMTEGREEDAMSLSSAFYAKILAQYIVAQYPRLKTVFDSWKREGGTSESLWSNVQKNQELKTILLNETPWITEAKSEAERKQRLSTLFDVNSLTYSIDATLQKLRGLQGEDGGWSWFEGMSSNDYTTLSIAEQLARLEKLTGKETKAHDMLEKAVIYLMKKVRKRYEQSKNDKKTYDASSFVLRTYYIQSLSGELKEDACARFFLDGWEKHLPSLSNEDKARFVIIMNAVGRKSTARDLANSLVEYTVQSEEQGRYFDTTSINDSFYGQNNRIPVQTLAIEALKECRNYPQETNDMIKWLLKQKQALLWGNAVQSADTNYALLIGSSTEMLDHQAPAILEVNGKEVMTDKDMAELGYIHYSYNSGSIIERPSTLTIIKKTPGIAWGSVYAQYTLPLEKIQSSATANDSVKQALSIRREFYIERTENGKSIRIPLNNVEAQVGDKLISRLIVKADRDLDFVQIKDGRTACLESAEDLSGYRSGDRIGYYESKKDASINYYCDHMNKGSYIFESISYIDRSGSYISGTANVQCAYAPEFISRAEPVHINVK